MAHVFNLDPSRYQKYPQGTMVQSLHVSLVFHGQRVVFGGFTFKQSQVDLVCVQALTYMPQHRRLLLQWNLFPSLPDDPNTGHFPNSLTEVHVAQWNVVEVKDTTSRPDPLDAAKLDGDTELQDRRSPGLWMKTWTHITNSTWVKSKQSYSVELPRSENLLQPLALLTHSQALAMQIEIQITFNEMKFNEISL